MNDEEIRSTLEQIKAQVKAKPENKDKSDDEIDEMILDAFLKAYTEGQMTKEDLGGLAEAMGYEFTEEFNNDAAAGNEANPAPAEGGEGEPAPVTNQEQLEDVRTIEPGESTEEFKEKVEDVKEGNAPESEPEPAPAPANNDDNADGNGEEEDSEEDERKKASELWKLNLNK